MLNNQSPRNHYYSSRSKLMKGCKHYPTKVISSSGKGASGGKKK